MTPAVAEPSVMARFSVPDTPFLALDLEAFERNVDHMLHTIVKQGGKRWRPHTKALRSPHIAQRLLRAGASGVTCATVPEAQAMVDAGIADVLIASQVVQPRQLQQLAALNRYARVIAAIDSPVHAALLETAAAQIDVRIPFVVEVNIGLDRAGVVPGAAAYDLARHVLSSHRQLRFCGVMAWEGHVNRVRDPLAKEGAIRAAVGLLVNAAHVCSHGGLDVEIVSCGGTGTYPVASGIAGVTELQAGGGVFGDLRTRNDFGMPLELALSLHSTVLSRPSARRIVCDAGWKYHGIHPTLSQPLGLPGVVQMAHAAEHLTLDCAADVHSHAVGDRLDWAVGYADSTVFLHRVLVAMRNGAVENVVPVPNRL